MIVVDTNIIAYYLIISDFTSRAVETRQKDPEWVSPYLWRSEFRNVLMLYIKRQAIGTVEAVVRMEMAEALVKSTHVRSARVLELASASGCTAYDCEFVSAAERLHVPLVTTDKEVLAAFPGLAVSMDQFLG